MPNIAAASKLDTLYARFAKGWHQSVSRLGYLAAYDQLVAVDQGKRAIPAGAVLDAGTGTGAFSLSFLKANSITHLTLLDTSPEMLELAEQNLQSNTVETVSIHGALGAARLDTEVFETILCAHVIEHTPSPADSLRWFHSRLAPGGTLLLSVSKPHWCTAIVRWRWGHKAFRPCEVVEMLENAGFEDISIVQYKSGPPSRTSSGYRAVRPLS